MISAVGLRSIIMMACTPTHPTQHTLIFCTRLVSLAHMLQNRDRMDMVCYAAPVPLGGRDGHGLQCRTSIPTLRKGCSWNSFHCTSMIKSHLKFIIQFRLIQRFWSVGLLQTVEVALNGRMECWHLIWNQEMSGDLNLDLRNLDLHAIFGLCWTVILCFGSMGSKELWHSFLHICICIHTHIHACTHTYL